ncbi:MAG TPA: hypothetical protein VLX09_22515 [Stellaceae bacterium]|nr:hypothetical protein [Stellaceae bacterium]
MTDSGRDSEARRKAEAALAPRRKQDNEIVQQRAKERETSAEKVARLRELRLAKEAAEAQAKPKARLVASRRKSGTQG